MELSPQMIVQAAMMSPHLVTNEMKEAYQRVATPELRKVIPGSVISTIEFSISFYVDAMESLRAKTPVRSALKKAEDAHPSTQHKQWARDLGIEIPSSVSQGDPSGELFLRADRAIALIAKSKKVEDPVLLDGYPILFTEEVIQKRLRYFGEVLDAYKFLFDLS